MLALMKDFSDIKDDINQEDHVEAENKYSANMATQVTIQTETLKVLTELQKQLLNLTNEVKSGGKQNKKSYF